jgi:hypothetical protein
MDLQDLYATRITDDNTRLPISGKSPAHRMVHFPCLSKCLLMLKVSECPYKAYVRGLLEKDTVLPHEKASRVVSLGLSLPHLRQGCLRLGQPEGHVHGAIQCYGSGERGAGLLRLP